MTASVKILDINITFTISYKVERVVELFHLPTLWD